jgi:hypothetical protein
MHLEPDTQNGNAYLEAVKQALTNANRDYKKLAYENDRKKEDASEEKVSLELYNYECARDKKFTSYFNLLDKWLEAKENNRTVGGLLLDRGYHAIAIYGMGKVGKHLIFELKDSDVDVLYFIDRKSAGDEMNGIPIYAPDDSLTDVDAIIVTAVFDFENIKLQLEKQCKCPIVSLSEIFEGN